MRALRARLAAILEMADQAHRNPELAVKLIAQVASFEKSSSEALGEWRRKTR